MTKNPIVSSLSVFFYHFFSTTVINNNIDDEGERALSIQFLPTNLNVQPG